LSKLEPDREPREAVPDPLNTAALKLFGLSYLFPYQRLVMANILETAAARGVSLHWPEGDAPPDSSDMKSDNISDNLSDEQSDDSSCNDGEEWGGRGRQIVILPTGAGKSLCFQLPAMLMEGPSLIIYPILSLMADQERRLKERGFDPVVIRGGQSPEERRLLWEKVQSGQGRFLIANPEVLLSPAVMEKLPNLGILHVVIDEAHCVSEWGESFRPSYLRLGEIIAAIGGTSPEDDPAGLPLVTAFTATASDPVMEKIDRYIFGGRGAHRIVGNPDRSNIRYAARGCILRDQAVLDLIVKNERPAIVFCSSRRGTENLARYLRNELAESEVRFYHAGLSREEKTDVEGWFFQSPGGILTATCAYGMGVDKPNIRTVIHRDCPPSAEAYLQESGRAGRDGLPSRACLLWGPGDALALRRAKTPADRDRLSALFAYARSPARCRRQALLDLLNYTGAGESPEGECCDVCAGESRGSLREEPPLLDFFRRNGRRYTLGEAAAVLSHLIPAWSDEDAKQAINQLLRDRRLKKGSLCWKNKLSLDRRTPPQDPAHPPLPG
jgi:ATP-dependent DNA helicase RecQ